jgi:3-hydroxyisobutyrate dehydrogenase-like beta-hydroxyacid dehydrogenase
MSDGTNRSPREPWTGYAEQSAGERERLLARKFEQAKEHGEQDYAMALTAAVANYELVLELLPDTQHAEDVAAAAHDLHDDAGSWKPN